MSDNRYIFTIYNDLAFSQQIPGQQVKIGAYIARIWSTGGWMADRFLLDRPA
jgi:hypothetical protein